MWKGNSVDFKHGALRVSDNQRFLQHADGTPFFWLGDTAWELFHRLSREEADWYLEKRRAQGFTLIQAVALAEFDGLDTPNAYGHKPLIDNDPTQLNEDYFAHVDWIIDRAASKGLFIGFLPTWGDKVVKNAWGAGPLVFNEDNAYSYGFLLGRRYGNRPNIVWILGGDRPAIWKEQEDYTELWRAMSQGLDAGAGRHLLTTYHPSGSENTRTSKHLHNEAWLDMNMMQSGHGGGHDVPVWNWVAEDYALSPAKPTLDGEPNYEDHPVNPWPAFDADNGYFRDHDVRKQLYRSVFAGACGVTYGHHSMWQFWSPRFEVVNHADRFWTEAIDRPGAQQVAHLRRLMESRPFFTRVPDQSVLACDAGARGSHMVATRDSDRRYGMIYVPNTQTVDVNMDAVAGDKARVSWYNPRTGTTTLLGLFATKGTRFFTTPDHGPDWVLLLDQQ
jgi:hypothetical protein